MSNSHLRRTMRMSSAATCLAELPYHPGWAIIFHDGVWFIGHPDDYPPSSIAVPPRCRVGFHCSRPAGHAGPCEPMREEYAAQ